MSVVRRTLGLLVLSTVLALVLTLAGSVPLGAGPATAAPAAPSARSVASVGPAALAAAPPAARKGPRKAWRPRAGATFNNPLGGRRERRRIVRQVIKAIDHTPRGGQIRVASWNVRNAGITRALASAHRRGATVRMIMSRGNLGTSEDPNPGVRSLVHELSTNGNDARRPARRSHVKTCVSSCRGTSGISHSKFFLFSRTGRARWVVMNGSFNATDLASSNQWNEIYTVRGKPGMYDAFRGTFAQMWRDKPVRKAFTRAKVGPVTAFFYPYAGPRARRLDPALSELKAVRCRGARNTASGRTKVRIAMTSWFGERGTRLAWRVRRMQNHGCDVKIVYAVMGNEVLRILRREGRRPVRMRQIVQDFDGDGVYDRYLHMKVLTIRGRYRGDRSAWITVNGSANWSPAVLNSDEAVLRIKRPSVLRDYDRWITKLYRHPPETGQLAPLLGRRLGVLDPYAEIEVD
ncbi:phospholipase D-like domain-containing protein [Nocardioides sp. NPDC092400]|uniref:phospholipase D-like domain-containing protein n=1 Tax=Nocardioides sp. NPDC092400 TaxID=3155196 RepID=UPI00342159F0